MLPVDDDDRDWMSLRACARQMGVHEDEVFRLVEAGHLRARNLYGHWEVEPAIVA